MIIFTHRPLGPFIISTSPTTPSDSRSGLTRTVAQTDNFCTPVTVLCSPPDPAHPDPPPRRLTPHPLCFTFAPALSFLCPSRSGVATHDEWGIALVLCWPGFTATAHRPPSARPSVDLHYLPPHPATPNLPFACYWYPLGLGGLSIACYSTCLFHINSGKNVFV